MILNNIVDSFPFVGIQHFTCPHCKKVTKLGISYEELAGIRNFRPTSKHVPCNHCNKEINFVFKYVTREDFNAE